MASHLLDSNILILALHSQASALDLMDDLRTQGALCISVVTHTEVLAGMHPYTLIAATAMAHNLFLVTTNARHFPIEGLQVLPFAPRG